jgi:hypothetical protein
MNYILHTIWKHKLYRDVWLTIISIVLLLSVSEARNISDNAKSHADFARNLSIQNRAITAQNRRILRRVDVDRKNTNKQFCQLINGTQADRIESINQTEKFLAGPGGKENSFLIKYIRNISLPRLKKEADQEGKRIPKICISQKRSQDFRNPDRRIEP